MSAFTQYHRMSGHQTLTPDKAFPTMRIMQRQTTELHSCAPVSFLLKSITAIMVNRGLVAEMPLNFLPHLPKFLPILRFLRLGMEHFVLASISFVSLDPAHFHCLERDKLSLMAALRYELPSQGLLYKRPLIYKGEDMDFSRFGNTVFDLIYVSAVFLHMPDKLVWVGLERLVPKLKPSEGRIFVSHNIKFCSRLGGEECTRRLSNLGLEYVGKHTHDSLLFNHYEIWFEFRRSKE